MENNYIVFNDANNFDKSNSMGIIQISFEHYNKLVYNQIHKKQSYKMPSQLIKSEFKSGFRSGSESRSEFESESNIIIMGELNKSQVELYLDIYNDDDESLDKFNELIIMSRYYQVNPEKYYLKKKLSNELDKINKYWENSYNCKFNLNNNFFSRKFNSMNVNLVENINLSAEINANTNLNESNNYLEEIIKTNKWFDMSIKKYSMAKNVLLTNDEITEIYNYIPTEYFQYKFIGNMICSRTYCHLILNNYSLMKIISPLINKYKIVFKYLIGYGWLSLKSEEYFMFNNVKDDSRIVFDIDTANLLPIFPFCFDDINQNPYSMVLMDNELIDLNNNCMGMNQIENYERYYGVCDSREFEKRLNIFVNGSNVKGVLDYIDWSCCAITGSAMTCCGMKLNPLMELCKNHDGNELTDEDILRYFNYYYSDSDIDMLCNKIFYYDFIMVVTEFLNKIRLNYANIQVGNIHTSSILMSKEFIQNNLLEIRELLSNEMIDVEWIEKNIGMRELKKYFYDKYYLCWKNEQKQYFATKTVLTDANDELIKEFTKPISEEEFKLFVLNYELEKLVENDNEKYFYSNENKVIAKLTSSIRFKIDIPSVKTFEIFKSRDENFFSIISKFHLGLVRAYWNGQTVKCLPSYISAMMLQMATDYKYFASVRNPIEIINKYRSRGFGIILNDWEKMHMIKFNSNIITSSNGKNSNENWVRMYNINIQDKQSVKNIFGAKIASDEIFKPAKYFSNLPDSAYKNVELKFLKTFDECFNTLLNQNDKLNIILNLKTIDSNGDVIPLDKNIIDFGWKLINQKN